MTINAGKKSQAIEGITRATGKGAEGNTEKSKTIKCAGLLRKSHWVSNRESERLNNALHDKSNKTERNIKV